MFNLGTFQLQIFLISVKIWIKKMTATTPPTTKIKTREKISSCHMDFQHGDGKKKKTSFPNIQMCIIPAVEIMSLWQKKKKQKNITSVIQHPVMLWLEKVFLHGKKHNKASSVQLFAALTLKAYGENRQWHKVYKAKLFSQPLTFKAQEIP